MSEHILPSAEVEKAMEIAPVESETALPSPSGPSSSVYDKITNVIEFVSVMGRKLAKSGFAGITRVEQGELIMMECIARRMSPMEFISTFHIIQNKVSMRADAMLAKFRERGGKVHWKQFDDEAAVADFIVDGHTTEISYTMKDAARAKLANRSGSWAQHTGAMLRSRCVARGVRMTMPEAITGYYTPEELSDNTPAQG